MSTKKLELLYEQIANEQGLRPSASHLAANIGPMGLAQRAGSAFYDWLKKANPEFDVDGKFRKKETGKEDKEKLALSPKGFTYKKDAQGREYKIFITNEPLKGFHKNTHVPLQSLAKYGVTQGDIDDLKSKKRPGITIQDQTPERNFIQIIYTSEGPIVYKTSIRKPSTQSFSSAKKSGVKKA